jgi:hypothetical protein
LNNMIRFFDEVALAISNINSSVILRYHQSTCDPRRSCRPRKLAELFMASGTTSEIVQATGQSLQIWEILYLDRTISGSKTIL